MCSTYTVHSIHQQTWKQSEALFAIAKEIESANCLHGDEVNLIPSSHREVERGFAPSGP